LNTEQIRIAVKVWSGVREGLGLILGRGIDHIDSIIVAFLNLETNTGIIRSSRL
jgi:hypothetical protein